MFPCDYFLVSDSYAQEYCSILQEDVENECNITLTCEEQNAQCIDNTIVSDSSCYEENMYYDLNNLVCVDLPLEFCTGLKCWDIIE